jgi:hypothetical protein
MAEIIFVLPRQLARRLRRYRPPLPHLVIPNMNTVGSQ